MAAAISIREFARREGVSDTLVRKAIAKGRLTAGADGRLDAALVGTDWRVANRPAADRASHVAAGKAGQGGAAVAPTPAPSTAARAASAAGHAPSAPAAPAGGGGDDDPVELLAGLPGDPRHWSLAQAERWKEIFLALQRQLKFEVESGRYVLVDEVVAQVEREYATVRERLLVIPGKLAALLVGQTREAIEAALQSEIAEALRELHEPGVRADEAGDRSGETGEPAA